MSDSLSKIFPAKEIIIAEMPFTLKPLTFGQLPKVMKLMEKLAGPVQKAVREGKQNDISTVIMLFAEGGDGLIEVMAESIKAPKEFVENLDSDEGIKFLNTFLEVNKDFFIQRVLPLIQEKMGSLQTGQK